MADAAVRNGASTSEGRRYHFDLIRNGTVIRDPAGLVLRDSKHAVAVGEKLAKKLFIKRSMLRGSSCLVRICDEHGLELAKVEVDVS
jgi:hypothetical protein